MDYLIDRDKNNNIISIVEIHSISMTDRTYIISKWKTVYGTEPFSGKLKRLYRSYSSVKPDREWIKAIYEYWRT